MFSVVLQSSGCLSVAHVVHASVAVLVHSVHTSAFKARPTLCGVSMGALSLIVGAVACVPGALAIALRGRVPVGEWLLLLS